MRLAFIEGPKDGAVQDVTTPPGRVTVQLPVRFSITDDPNLIPESEIQIAGQYIPTGRKTANGELIYQWNPL